MTKEPAFLTYHSARRPGDGMRRFVLVGAAMFVVAAIGGAVAWATSRPDVEQLTVHEAVVAPAPISGTEDASVVWSGDEFIVWGGGSGDKVAGQVHSSGAAYNPATNSWRELAAAPIEARERHTAVWTGTEMVVWGGTRRHYGVGELLDGARYDPGSDSWRAMSRAPAGTDRSGGQSVVVDDQVVIGAGFGPTGDEERKVLVYDLAEDRWDTVRFADPVIDVLHVDDRVALLTAGQGIGDGNASELRVELLDPVSGDVKTVGTLEAESYPEAAGLLRHDDTLTLVVSRVDGTSALYPIGLDGPAARLVMDRSADISAPVRLLGGPQPQPVLQDGSRRMVIPLTRGLVGGIDLVTGGVARGGLDDAAVCLANASHAVGGSRLFIWGSPHCAAEAGGPAGSALVEVGWDAAD